jgi:TonB family protein
MSISIPFYDFAPSKLVCLATSLRKRYPNYRNIEINIFSSREDAQSAIYVQESDRWVIGISSRMHAQYSYDAGKHEDYVRIMPTGAIPGGFSFGPGPFSTRIDLPTEAALHCDLEINNRCLIALRSPSYPDEALQRRTSGSVTLAATITRAGKVDHIQVVKAESIAPNEAIQNLSSWHLEPGPHDQPIQITYSYAIDNSLRRMDGMQVQWALPNAVSIRIPPH